jgi:hypothetical protein
MARGACNCGGVAFEIQADLADVYVCHCSICRRSSGANGMAVVLVNKDQFRWSRGEELVVSWTKPGTDWHKWFCRNCGSPVPGMNDESRLFVPAGLISEGGESLKVVHHIWVDSRAPWDVIGDTGRQHREAFQKSPDGTP